MVVPELISQTASFGESRQILDAFIDLFDTRSC